MKSHQNQKFEIMVKRGIVMSCIDNANSATSMMRKAGAPPMLLVEFYFSKIKGGTLILIRRR